MIFTNLTERGGRLQLIDLYYDWPGCRNLNLIRDQLSVRFPVGVLPPDWLVDGAVYLGRETTDGFDCHLWTKVDFVWYYEDVVTHRPVRWNFFNGREHRSA